MPSPAALVYKHRLSGFSLLALSLSWTGIVSAQPPDPVPQPPAPRPRARLGVTIRGGVFIEGIQPNSVAERLGIQKFDLVSKVNGIPVTDTLTFATLIGNLPIDKPASLLVFRSGKPMILRADSLRPNPDLLNARPVPAPDARPARFEAGEEVPASPELFQQLITAYFEDMADGSSIAPQKVSVSFDALDFGDAQPNTTVTADGKRVQRIPALAADRSYYLVTTRVTILENYADGIEYKYQLSPNFLAYTIASNARGVRRWVVTVAS